MTETNNLKVKLFTKDNCAPCNTLGFTFDMMSEELSNTGADIVRYNTDAEPQLVEEYDISSVPVTVVEKDGKEVKRFMGMYNVTELVDLLNKEKQ